MDRVLTLAALAPNLGTLHQHGRSWSRAELDAEAHRLRASVAAVAGRGEVVEVPAPDPVTALAFLEAAWLEGRIPTPRARAVGPARALGCDAPDPNTALVIRTSGSTGEPKHVAFDAASVLRSANKIALYLGLEARDCVGIVQSLEHGYGLVGQLFSALNAGSDVVWAGAVFPAEQASTLDAAAITVLASVPYTLSELLRAGLRGARVRCVGSAGGPLSAPLAARLREAFPGAVLWNQYGCTEAGPRLTACSSDDPAFARGSVGRAVDGVELVVSADFEVLFAADTTMLGYVGNAAATHAARVGRFVKTGDLGRLENGHLFITGRSDEVVKVRGQKVPLALVATAAEHCGARVAIAVAIPREGSGELEICVIYEADSDLTRLALAKRLPLECAPSRLLRVPRLPRLASGKIDRDAAARLARGGPP